MTIRLWTVAVGLVALATVGCGTRVGSSGGGSGGTGPAPLVVITPIGYKQTSAAGANPMTLTARSGADVTLSAKDSDGGPVALKTFNWSQSGGDVTLPAAPDIGALLYRTSNTVSFRAPQVAAAAKLSFKVVVTNALGGTATGNVDVTVLPANDTDQLLVPPTKPLRFEVGVATVDGLDKSTLSGDVPVCVRVSRQVKYASRDGVVHTPVALPQLASLQADTSWSASANAAAAKDATTSTLTASSVSAAMQGFSNPRVAFEVPSFNDEELFAMYNQPGGDTATLLPQQLVPSDVDTAQLLLSISATPGSCDGTHAAPDIGTKLVVAVLDAGQNTPFWSSGATNNAPATLNTDSSSAPLTSDTLLASITTNAQIETAESARAYYLALDPDSHKTTLNDWLDANCFDHTAADYGVAAAGANGAHAVYTNNFDLGFGRDMYFMKCAATNTSASVVINYASLEQAALKQSPIIAVAMEYGAAAGGANPNHRFTKFYVFAPDDRDGLLKRVGSANFDRRGQKYVPGACTSCHGGTLPVLPANFVSARTPYPVIQDPTLDTHANPASLCTTTTPAGCLAPGDVDAAFLPWDLDSLLYADTDPAFTGESIPKTGFNRADQEAHLKALNVLAHDTFEPEMEPQTVGATTTQVDRYAAVRSLVEGWYGGANFPNATYSDAAPPASWTSWTTPSASADLFHNVFARNCRACHSVNPQLNIQFSGPTGYTDFVNEFVTTIGATPTGGSGGQHVGKAYVFQQGYMPGARLTMDRFWVNYDGGDSAAKTLATHLSQAIGATDLLTGSGNAVAPDQPVISVKVNGLPADTTTGLFTAARFAGARVEASTSFFATSFQWSLCISPTQGGTCVAAPVIGSTTAAPGIDTSAFGYYTLSLVAGNGVGQTVTQTYTLFVPDSVPTAVAAASCLPGKSASFDTTTNGAVVPLAAISCFSPTGEPPYTLTISSDGATFSGAPITGTTVPWNASVVAGAIPGVNFNFTPAAPATGNKIYFKWCDVDSECAVNVAAIGLTGSLQPSSTAILAYYDPTLNPQNTSGADLALPSTGQPIVGPGTPSVSLSALQNDLSLGVPAGAAVSLTLGLTPAARGSLSATQLNGTSVADLKSQISLLTFTPANTAADHCVDLDILGQAVVPGAGGCASATLLSNQLSSASVTPTPAARNAPIRVQALASYSQVATASSQPSVFSILVQNCAATGGCHLSGNSNAGVNWVVTPGSADTTYGSVRVNITAGSPTANNFYTAACISGYPGMARVFGSENTTPCHILYQWVLEGAPND